MEHTSKSPSRKFMRKCLRISCPYQSIILPRCSCETRIPNASAVFLDGLSYRFHRFKNTSSSISSNAPNAANPRSGTVRNAVAVSHARSQVSWSGPGSSGSVSWLSSKDRDVARGSIDFKGGFSVVEKAGDAEKTELKTRLRLVVMVEVGGIVGGLMGMHCVQPAMESSVVFFIDGPSFQALFGWLSSLALIVLAGR